MGVITGSISKGIPKGPKVAFHPFELPAFFVVESEGFGSLPGIQLRPHNALYSMVGIVELQKVPRQAGLVGVRFL